MRHEGRSVGIAHLGRFGPTHGAASRRANELLVERRTCRSGRGAVTDGAASSPRRGRPRSEQARLAILDAAAGLLFERGLAEVSMDAVAKRAGVSKATIYRWWPTKETLALEAVYRSWAEVEPPPPDTGTLPGDLLALLLPWVAHVTGRPYGRLLAAFIAQAQTDAAFAKQFRAFGQEFHLGKGEAVFSQAVSRGEIPTDTDIHVAVDLVFGPICYRLLLGQAPLSDDFVIEVVARVMAALHRAA